jgi:hypothetical protein
MNDSTQGLAHRLILTLDPERRRNRWANHRAINLDLPGFLRTLKLPAISDVRRRKVLLSSRVST